MSKCFPLLWQLFSQHKHWHGDSHLLVGRFALFTLLARLISLGFHHRANAGSASQLWKWLPWQAPGILFILGWWVHLIYCGPFQKSLFHSPTLSLAVAGPGYEYPAPPTSFPIYTWLSSLPLLLSLSLFHYSSIYPRFFSDSLPLQLTIHPALFCSFICSLLFSFSPSFSSAIISPCSSWLYKASSTTASILVSFIYFSLAPHSLPLVPCPSVCLHVISFSIKKKKFLSFILLNAPVFPQ